MSEILNKIRNLTTTMYYSNEKERFDDLEQLEKHLEAFPKYNNAVINESIKLEIIKFRYEGEALRTARMELDQARREAHQLATISVNFINKLAVVYNQEKIFNVNHLDFDNRDDRETAAVITFGLCKEIFLDSKELERYNQVEEYDYRTMDEELADYMRNRTLFDKKLSIKDLIDEVSTDDGGSSIPGTEDISEER